MSQPWELSKKDLDDAMNSCNPEDAQDGKCRGEDYYCQAIAHLAVRKLYEWLEGNCQGHPGCGLVIQRRLYCPHCLNQVRLSLEQHLPNGKSVESSTDDVQEAN